MISLTDSQQEQVRGIVESSPSRVEERLERLQRGDVVDHKVPSSYGGVATKCQKVAVCYVYEGEVEAAQEWFERATENYGRAATAALERPPFATTYRKVPMTLVQATYAAACAAAFDEASDAAVRIFDLDPLDGIEDVEGDIVFEPDKYYLARCFGGAILDRLEQDDLEHLEAINDDKPAVDALYGRAIIEFATGVRHEDADLVEQSIRTILDHHDRDRHEDNVVDMVMSVDASALYVLARYLGYSVDVESRFLPEALIEESQERLG